MSDNSEDWLGSTSKELEQFLNRPAMEEAVQSAARSGVTAANLGSTLDGIVELRSVPAKLQGIEPLVGRWMLVLAALQSLDRIPELPVTTEVKQLICTDYQFYSNLNSGQDALFQPESSEFQAMAAIARLRRYIAGQIHWQISGIPRSWPFRMQWQDAVRTLATAAGMGGFAPCFEAHIPRRGAPFLFEREYKPSYVSIAQSMELQPHIRGVFSRSWMYSEETLKISPHLRWLVQLYVENGGTLAHMGAAPENSGFLVGSPKRKQMYESGEYRPRLAVIVWPRAALLEWARRQ